MQKNARSYPLFPRYGQSIFTSDDLGKSVTGAAQDNMDNIPLTPVKSDHAFTTLGVLRRVNFDNHAKPVTSRDKLERR